MSLVIERFLICDGECGRNYGVDFRNCSTSFIRKSARQDGWTKKGSKDYCDECSRKTKEGAEE